jgi:hypothetical protein
MNSGIIANILIMCIIILLLSGWFERIIKEFKLKRSIIITLLVIYIILSNSWYSIPYTNIIINIGGIIVPTAFLLLIFYLHKNSISISKIISASIFTASLLLMIYEIIPKDPRLYLFDNMITYPLLLAVSTILIIKKPLEKYSLIILNSIASVILSVVILDIISVFLIPRSHTSYVSDGHSIDLMLTTILTIIVSYSVLEVLLLKRKKLLVSKESHFLK